MQTGTCGRSRGLAALRWLMPRAHPCASVHPGLPALIGYCDPAAALREGCFLHHSLAGLWLFGLGLGCRENSFADSLGGLFCMSPSLIERCNRSLSELSLSPTLFCTGFDVPPWLASSSSSLKSFTRCVPLQVVWYRQLALRPMRPKRINLESNLTSQDRILPPACWLHHRTCNTNCIKVAGRQFWHDPASAHFRVLA